METRRLNGVYWALLLTYAIVPIVAGLDKFAYVLVDWSTYLSATVREALPISPGAFMGIVGGIEVVAGLLVLFVPRVGGIVVGLWLLGIAANLILGGYFDIAVRDIAMAVGAFCLARLAAVHREARRAPAAVVERPVEHRVVEREVVRT